MARLCHGVCLACLVLAAGCGNEPSEPASQEPPLAPQPIAAADEPVRISIVQRTSEPIPGWDDRVRIHIEDITDGSVQVKVASEDGGVILPPTSMRLGEALPFEHKDGPFTIRLVDLKNYLAGDDYAEFEVAVAIDEAEPISQGNAVLDEQQKIEHLINNIERLQGAAFIRNGKEYTPAEAAEHMRNKWKWKKNEIDTASDFILIAATKSSMSGELYLIRYADGREVPAGEYFHEELDRLE